MMAWVPGGVGLSADLVYHIIMWSRKSLRKCNFWMMQNNVVSFIILLSRS